MFPGYFLGNETRITMLRVSHIGEHISLGTIGLCVFYAGKDITRDMCFTARGTKLILLGLCVFQVGGRNGFLF